MNLSDAKKVLEEFKKQNDEFYNVCKDKEYHSLTNKQIQDALSFFLSLSEKLTEPELGKIIKSYKLSQSVWEDSEDIVTCNGTPIGMTITKHKREFDRWLEDYQNILVQAILTEITKEIK